VTIASTNTILAFASLQGAPVEVSLVVWTIVGLLCVGLMNFFVSFALALSVAVRASGVRRALIGFFFNPFHSKSKTAPLE
jgi:site-specific recombinase